MRKISSNIFLGYFTIIIILASLLVYISTKSIEQSHYKSSVEQLDRYSSLIKSIILKQLQTNQTDSLKNFFEKIADNTNIRVSIISENGEVLLDSYVEVDTLENHSHRPEIIAAFEGNPSHSLRFSTTLQKYMLYYAIPIQISDNNQYVLRLSYYKRDISHLYADVTNQILIITLIFVLLALLLSYFLANTISKPITKLIEASKSLAEGNLDFTVRIKMNNEIRNLAENLNTMASKLKKNIKTLKSQKKEYDVLITSIKEGLLVINDSGKILIKNPGVYHYFNKKIRTGDNIFTIIETGKFRKFLYKIIADKGNITKEIIFNNKILIISAVYVRHKKEHILLMHDISAIRDVEQFKKELIQNVSHELKTPMTAIKGFVETLDEEIENPEHKNYIGIILRHSDRLISIVQDLLTISELEEAEFSLMLSHSSISNLIHNVISMYEPKAKLKNIILTYNNETKNDIAQIDSFRMEQVLINLIDNAIKYSDEGNIDISLKNDNCNFSIEIKDTGVGISQEDQIRIFDRFYCVDKSRSRKAGGTGLGLSIVKHIIHQHKGTIVVSSKIGKGTSFTISIPNS